MKGKSLRLVGALVAALLGTSSCAQERDPINRVQADALDKSFFVGPDLVSTADDPEFYRRGTVVDVVYGAGQDGLFTSTYAQPLSRIKFEITEDKLNARLSYERISGTDNKGNSYSGVQRKPANDGQIVASYKIVSHFDIKREYNPQTGEELNIVSENTTDRVWYERQYFRVDWSANLVTDVYDYDTLSLMGVIGGVSTRPFPIPCSIPRAPTRLTSTPRTDTSTSPPGPTPRRRKSIWPASEARERYRPAFSPEPTSTAAAAPGAIATRRS